MPDRPLPPEKRDLRLMQGMFTTIAPRYDFITRAFSYGMDWRWKREGVERAGLPEAALVLDLACGTGDFSQMVTAALPRSRPIAVDVTPRMLALAREAGVPNTVCADALRLPFSDAVFDAVFVGYGLRNFPDLKAALAEIRRVTRPGGMLVSLDFFLPQNRVVRRLYLWYLYVQGAFWGWVLHGRPRIYTYIPDSLRGFVSAPEFSQLLERSGYREVHARRFLLGGIGLHWARRG